MNRVTAWAIATLLTALIAPEADAARAPVNDAKIEKVLVTDPDQFGGCLIRLSKDIPGTLDCNNKRWVTLDCSNDFPESGKDVAYRKLDLATVALALGSSVTVQVDDARKHNVDYCYGRQVQLMPAPATP